MINSYTKIYRFLTNYWPCKVMLDGVEYPAVEHAFHAAKTTDPEDREFLLGVTAKRANEVSKEIPLPPGWDETRLKVMWNLSLQKYSSKNQELLDNLLGTGDEEILIGNIWHEKFWGYDFIRKQGENILGKMLVKIRDYRRKNIEDLNFENNGWTAFKETK